MHLNNGGTGQGHSYTVSFRQMHPLFRRVQFLRSISFFTSPIFRAQLTWTRRKKLIKLSKRFLCHSKRAKKDRKLRINSSNIRTIDCVCLLDSRGNRWIKNLLSVSLSLPISISISLAVSATHAIECISFRSSQCLAVSMLVALDLDALNSRNISIYDSIISANRFRTIPTNMP